MAATTNTVTYLEEEFTIGYDYELIPVDDVITVKHILTVEGETTPLYTLTRLGIIENMYLLIKEMLDTYLALEESTLSADAIKTFFEDWDGNLDTYLSEHS